MTQELILMADVEGLGVAGAVVKVADGYARNHLIPHKLAAPVSGAAMKQIEKKRKQREEAQKEEVEKARALATMLEKASCTITAKVGENEKMFGSVTAADIAESLAKQKIAIDKRIIQLDEAIRELGVYTIKISLHADVEASLKVWVVEE